RSQGSTANTHSTEAPDAFSGGRYSRYSSARGSGRSLTRTRTVRSGRVVSGTSGENGVGASRCAPVTSRALRKGPELRLLGPSLLERGLRDQAEHDEIAAQGEPEARGRRQDERVGLGGIEAGHRDRGRTGEEHADDGGQGRAGAEQQQRTLAERANHPDRQEVGEDLPHPRQPILAAAVLTRVVADFQLHDPGACRGGRYRRDEAMKVGIERESVDELPPVCLE